MIARKVSHCSKNVGGADAFSAFTSVIRTLARDGGDHSLVNGLCRWLGDTLWLATRNPGNTVDLGRGVGPAGQHHREVEDRVQPFCGDHGDDT